MTRVERVFDPGLQPERTALAWQRTILALGVAALAASRGLLPLFGASSYVIAGAGLAVIVAILIATDRRYRAVHRHLTTVDSSTLPSGGRLDD